MKPRCVPCLLNRVLFETILVTGDTNIQKEVLLQSMKIIEKEYNNYSSAHVATKVHQKAYQIMGSVDPYRDLKKKSNQVAKSLLPRAQELIAESNDSLQAAVLCSIIGNTIDFGIEGSASSPQDLKHFFEEAFRQGLEYNDLDCIRNRLNGNIVFFTDNCGEIVFDGLLCKELKKYDIHLTVVVKGAPILTDATFEDALYAGLDKIADEILDTGGFAIGIDFSTLSPVLLKKLKSAALLICKGMANYEAFSETNYQPIVYFLRVKCQSIAEDMGVPLYSNTVKFYGNK
jgi:uncharacterized protein with ATP-grasp and redox domains